LRSLLRSYEDDLEILVYACPVGGAAGAAGATGGEELVEFATRLQHDALPVAFAVGATRRDARLEALAAWTVRWSFDTTTLLASPGKPVGSAEGPRWPLASGAATRGERSGALAGTGLRPGIVVPPGLLNGGATRAASGSWSAAPVQAGAVVGTPAQARAHGGPQDPMLVEMLHRPGRGDYGQQLAHSIGDAIREGATRIVGAFADLGYDSAAPHAFACPDSGVDAAASAPNIDAVEALLDILANSVRQRRTAFATRPRGTLWSSL
jgi:hypothetical protein